MPRSYYGQFPDGVQIAGVNINVHNKGQIYYVCNSSVAAKFGVGASDNNTGLSPDYPLKTIAQAFTNCVASRGDKIILLPGHAETVSSSTALSLNKAGIEIVGVGSGNQRPQFTLNTATSATINVTAADIKISNVVFIANFAAIVSYFTLTTAKNFQLESCEFRDTSSALNALSVVTVDSTSNHSDGLSIINCNFFGLGTTSGTTVVNMAGTNDRPVIKDNIIISAAAVAGILMTTASGKNVTNANINNNIIQSAYTGSLGALIVAGGTSNTGVVSNNKISIAGGGTDLLVTASSGFGYQQNFLQGAADASGYLLPAADV